LIARHPFSARAKAGQAHLRIMGTTDLHAHILPYDYCADRPADTVGLARTAALAGALRAEAANALLVDNGDFLQGSPMGDHAASGQGMATDGLHPVIAAMNAAGFDAATLGNHDFNFGLEVLMRALAGARFPVVAANVVTKRAAHPAGDETLVPPYVILERRITDGAGEAHPLRIGLIGFVPPQIVAWDRRHLEGRVTTRDIVAAARAWVPRIRAAGADLVVALSHSGIAQATHSDSLENASVPLALVEGIDVLMTGHQHLVFPGDAFAGIEGVDAAAGTIHGKPAVMGGAWGSHLGVIDLLLERVAGRWHVVGHESGVRPIARRGPDGSVRPLVAEAPEVVAAVRGAHAATLAHVRRPVGRIPAPLHSYFALVGDAPAVRFVNRAQAWHVAAMLRGTAHADLPLLSAAAPLKAGGRGGPDHYTDVPAGDLAIRHVADLYPYPNTVSAVRVTGAQLGDWLERSAGIFRQVTPGARDQLLIDPDFPSYNFDVIDGLTWRIDISRPSRFGPKGELLNPEARRIVDLRHRGRPVDPAEEFVIATNSYRAGGGGDFPGARGDTIILETPDSIRDVLLRYIVETDTKAPEAVGDWSFVPLPGTTVLFDSGPAAAAYLPGVKGLTIEPAGEGPGGFARFRIAL
jgi:2',3'-cyclic-nucleotide 2'-phosphodiesterase/3'-nucleotidase